MSDNTLAISMNSKTLDEIRQKTITRLKDVKCATQNEEIAYLLGIVDALTNGVKWQAN
ncbi:MAG: hypothetical protein IJ520_04340 [Synergistaceae bacterium]|nr:hypothetical protein [Synergistaceae bacterium]MBR1604241.1 hypothetical protein [Synergistaceae bacterium]